MSPAYWTRRSRDVQRTRELWQKIHLNCFFAIGSILCCDTCLEIGVIMKFELQNGNVVFTGVSTNLLIFPI